MSRHFGNLPFASEDNYLSFDPAYTQSVQILISQKAKKDMYVSGHPTHQSKVRPHIAQSREQHLPTSDFASELESPQDLRQWRCSLLPSSLATQLPVNAAFFLVLKSQTRLK